MNNKHTVVVVVVVVLIALSRSIIEFLYVSNIFSECVEEFYVERTQFSSATHSATAC